MGTCFVKRTGGVMTEASRHYHTGGWKPSKKARRRVKRSLMVSKCCTKAAGKHSVARDALLQLRTSLARRSWLLATSNCYGVHFNAAGGGSRPNRF